MYNLYAALIPTPMTIKFNSMPPKTSPGELTIIWELAFDDTMNETRDQDVYSVLLNTSNCGTCPNTTSFNFTMCDLTENNVQLDICTVVVIIQDDMQCNITKHNIGELNLTGERQRSTIGNNYVLWPLQIMFMLKR